MHIEKFKLLIKIKELLIFTFTSNPFKDCSKGDLYSKRAAYKYNRDNRQLLITKILLSLIFFVALFTIGNIGENIKIMWIYLPSYISMIFPFIHSIILAYAYFYLNKWKYFNESL